MGLWDIYVANSGWAWLMALIGTGVRLLTCLSKTSPNYAKNNRELMTPMKDNRIRQADTKMNMVWCLKRELVPLVKSAPRHWIAPASCSPSSPTPVPSFHFQGHDPHETPWLALHQRCPIVMLRFGFVHSEVGIANGAHLIPRFDDCLQHGMDVYP